ncbi:winged helix-turn-helix domain-containing protein [Pluralibacter gergoviae]|uniref:winged helix-turn-helix domain-containing protein n=1 Tax=Pluralibacter gergoviae TaxID=61647 RepID=UPI003EE009ED
MNKCYGSVNNWLLDPDSGSILHLVTGERRRLGEYQIKLLSVLMQEAGRILTRDELTQMVWERRVIGNNSLPNAIHALRVALEDDGKQQKIIKTVPRRGYLLEPEYCRFVEKEESEVSAEPCPQESESRPDVCGQTGEQEMPQPTVVATREHPAARWRRRLTITLLLLLTAFVSIIVAGRMAANYEGDALRAQETQANVYSNIRLFALDRVGNPTWQQDNLYSKLKDSLYILNQRLKSQSVEMNVYYLSENQTLNYTFSLHSACDSRQLVMTIYHWRIDAQRLNNVIVRETRRKLDEMAICKAS